MSRFEADSIQTVVLAIRYGMMTKELGETIIPYLTTVKGLKLAAQCFRQGCDETFLLRWLMRVGKIG